MIYARPEITRHLVTAGNFGFVANNTDLYTLVKRGDKFTKRYNVAPGQLVMWSADPTCTTVPKTIAPANLDLTELANLKLGVGRDADGDGISESIRLISPTALQGCTIDNLDAVAPQCAVPQIKAIYPDCVSCDGITARVRVYDNNSISFSDDPLKAYHEFTESFIPNCGSCSDCPQTVTCDEVVCGLVDALNGDTDFKIDGDPYPHYWNTGVERPYKAFKLWPTWKSYCITPTVGAGCVNCNTIDDLTTYTIDSVAYNFNLTNPANATETLISQLDLAVEAINSKFEETIGKHGGFAFLSRGQGSCCPLQLFVSTCDTTFAIAGLVECEDAIDQFPDIVTAPTCKQCDSADTTITPACGIGIFVRPDTQPCFCGELNQPRQFMQRWVTIDIVSGSGNDNTPKYSHKATLLEGQGASGYGAEIQYLEYAENIEAIGFEGFQYDIGNVTSGWINTPRASSRLKQAVTADCNKSYCSYYLRHRGQVEYGPSRNFINMLIDGYLHVPENDSTTKTAVEALFTKIVALVPTTCTVLTSATCA